jgi:hypothetical protein
MLKHGIGPGADMKFLVNISDVRVDV